VDQAFVIKKKKKKAKQQGADPCLFQMIMSPMQEAITGDCN